jgi:hypothetical protein
MKFADPFEAHCPECNLTLLQSPTWFLELGQVCPNCKASLNPIRENMISASNQWKSFFNFVSICNEAEMRFFIEYEDKDIENRDFATVADVVDLTLEVLDRNRKIYEVALVQEEIINIIRNLSAVQWEIKPETELVELGSLW